MTAAVVPGKRPGVIKGSMLYRVVLRVAHPDEKQGDTWVVEFRVVTLVKADGTIRVNKFFTGSERKDFAPGALGIYFHTTADEAVREFAAVQRRNVERAERMVQEAEEALAWAEGWAFAQKKEGRRG